MHRLISILAIGAILAAWAAAVASIANGRTISDPQHPGMLFFENSTSIYISLLKLLGAIMFIGAGVLAIFHGGLQVLSLTNRLLFAVLILASCVWVLLAYEITELEKVIRQPTSPFIWLTLAGLFFGAQEKTGRLLLPFLNVAMFLTVPAALWSVRSLEHYGRFSGANAQVQYIALLFWPGVYSFLLTPGSSLWRILLRGVPIGTCVVLAVFSQSRGWLLLSVVASLLLVFRERRLNPSSLGWRTIKVGGFAVCVFAVLTYAVATYYPAAVKGLTSRLGEDTRLGQFQTFFEQVPVSDLILGQGPKAGYRFGTDAHYQSFDNQFLWILFIGGVPTLLPYLALIIFPGIRLFVRSRTSADFAAGGVIIVWTLACLGLSTYCAIGLSAQHYIVISLAGFCHQRLTESKLTQISLGNESRGA